jgi:tetratricopeptide (TPR) repeat protein
MKKAAVFVLVQVVVLAMFALSGRAETASPVLTGALQESYDAEKSKDYAKAIEPLEKLGTSGNSDYIVQYRLGWLNYCNKQYDESISHYKKAVQLAPNAVEPLLALMTVQMAAVKNDDALRTGQSVLTRDPNNYTATSRVAWLCYLQQDYRRAASLYRKLVTLYPTDTEMLLGLGYALKKAGDTKEGDACFQKVLLLSPDNARALEGLKVTAQPAPAAANGGPRGGGRGGPRR